MSRFRAARLFSMEPAELRFRVTTKARNWTDHARTGVVTPTWRRTDLARVLSPAVRERSADLDAARTRLKSGNWLSAHRALASHFTRREPRFPLHPRSLPDLGQRVNARFPDAAADASARADRMLDGYYDLLGYREVHLGNPPDWHRDPVHSREAPRRFWTTISYLDPQFGDHKIIWEINRHQHWLALGRAYQLTGNQRYYGAFVDQLGSWMASNPPLQGVNWASMLELGLRCLSWVWALHFFAPAAVGGTEQTSPWTVDLLVGVDRQLTHVERNLSRYFSPNTHLSGEALALYVGGLALPELRASEQRVRIGREILLNELDRQVHADGGHAELSAHYHRYTTDFYLLAFITARTVGDPAADALGRAARHLAEYLRTLTDDEGRLPLLGDDDGGQLFPVCARAPWDCRDTLAAAAAVLDDPSLAVSETPEEVFWLAGGLPLERTEYQPARRPSAALRDTGYYVSRTDGGNHLIFDAGHHGFLNGGHAHADALSVLLTIQGNQLLVDAGTGSYTADPQLRDRLRSTALHNTVVVNGASQSQMRGPFHWSSAAVARASVWQSHPCFDYAEGYHDGYPSATHTRGVLALHGFGWLILDHLVGDGQAQADTFWHIHPDWAATQAPDGIELRHRRNAGALLAASEPLEVLHGRFAEELALYAPVYGHIEHGICLRASTDGSLPRSALTAIVPAPTHSHRFDLIVNAVAVTDAPGGDWHGAAFTITTPTRQLMVLSAVPRAPAVANGHPDRDWGCAHASTDGRLAVIDLADPEQAVVIGGRAVHIAGTLAPSVHSQARTCA